MGPSRKWSHIPSKIHFWRWCSFFFFGGISMDMWYVTGTPHFRGIKADANVWWWLRDFPRKSTWILDWCHILTPDRIKPNLAMMIFGQQMYGNIQSNPHNWSWSNPTIIHPDLWGIAWSSSTKRIKENKNLCLAGHSCFQISAPFFVPVEFRMWKWTWHKVSGFFITPSYHVTSCDHDDTHLTVTYLKFSIPNPDPVSSPGPRTGRIGLINNSKAKRASWSRWNPKCWDALLSREWQDIS